MVLTEVYRVEQMIQGAIFRHNGRHRQYPGSSSTLQPDYRTAAALGNDAQANFSQFKTEWMAYTIRGRTHENFNNPR